MSLQTVEVSETSAITMEVQEPLSFQWLYGRVARYAGQTTTECPSRWERLAVGMALLSAGAGLLLAALSPSVVAPVQVLNLMKWALAAECTGVGAALALMLQRELPNWRRFRANHAKDMDSEFRLWREIVADLRGFPDLQREQMLSFAKRLREGMTYRMGLALGGVERLGVLPVLIALYLQFRGWKFGDWAAAFDVNLVGGLILWAVVLLYLMGWALVGLRVRLSTYIDLLEESLDSRAAR